MKSSSMTIFAIIVSLISLSSCSKADTFSEDDIVVNPTERNIPPTVNKELMLELVNAARKKGCQCGDTWYPSASAVVWNDKLELAAYKHSSEMYRSSNFTHVSADGSNGGVRLDAVGYTWTAYGENIGMGYQNENQVVDAWIKSPTHCKNMMNKDYKEMGVAKVGSYWTQDFGSRQ